MAHITHTEEHGLLGESEVRSRTQPHPSRQEESDDHPQITCLPPVPNSIGLRQAPLAFLYGYTIHTCVPNTSPFADRGEHESLIQGSQEEIKVSSLICLQGLGVLAKKSPVGGEDISGAQEATRHPVWQLVGQPELP